VNYAKRNGGFFSAYEDIWILDGVRTPFVDYTGAFGLVSPIALACACLYAITA
jgi:acetyl-CoA C-acetyltransferase